MSVGHENNLPAGLTQSERRAYDAFVGAGWLVARSGWPDFLVYDPTLDRGFGVEWKVGADVVRPAQDRMHLFMQSYFGIDVLVTGDISEALAFTPRDPLWLLSNQELIRVEKLRREATRLERACRLLRDELLPLENEWKKMKGFRDEQRARITRGEKRLSLIESRMNELRIEAATISQQETA